MTGEHRSELKWKHHVGDMANVLKAFLGCNYLSIPFAFSQSGLAGGVVFLVLIASMTDHCCHLIIKCKYHVIRRMMQQQFHNDDNEDEETIAIFKSRLLKCLNFGDVGKFCYGNPGLIAVDAALLFTQFGFCISYFIFVGNTLQNVFPIVQSNHSVIDNSSASNCVNTSSFYVWRDIGNSSLDEAQADKLFNVDVLSSSTDNAARTISSAPSLKLLVLFPLPLFLLFTYIRRLRNLGGISVVANLCIFFGYFAVLYLLSSGFCIDSEVVLFNATDFLLFFGMVTSSFEGIGTIVPIEASMEGNRHNFSKFLHLSILFLSIVLSTFGILGYLRYGNGTAQMINANIPPENSLGIAINLCLIFAVVFTFPLQIYPVIEIVEKYLFARDQMRSQPEDNTTVQEASMLSSDPDKEALIPKQHDVGFALNVVSIPDSVAAWKRNMVRTLIVLAASGLAVLLRNSYAYFGGFVGAIGSTMLAYILPCLFHLKICWHELPLGIKVKDVCLMTIGSAGGIVSLYFVMVKIINNIS